MHYRCLNSFGCLCSKQHSPKHGWPPPHTKKRKTLAKKMAHFTRLHCFNDKITLVHKYVNCQHNPSNEKKKFLCSKQFKFTMLAEGTSHRVDARKLTSSGHICGYHVCPCLHGLRAILSHLLIGGHVGRGWCVSCREGRAINNSSSRQRQRKENIRERGRGGATECSCSKQMVKDLFPWVRVSDGSLPEAAPRSLWKPFSVRLH